MAYFKSTSMRPKNYVNRPKGFKPANPPKIPEKRTAAEERVGKYDLDTLLQQDAAECAKIEAAIEVTEIMRAIPDKIKSGDDLLRLLEERDSYLDLVEISPRKKVHNLMLSERPKGKNLLKHLEPQFVAQIKQISSVEEAQKFQDRIQGESGFNSVTMEYKEPISREMRRVIRMEFNGGINLPDEDDLSPAYAGLAKDNRMGEGIYKAAEYDLADFKIWKDMARFPNFAKLESEFKAALAFQNVPPEMLSEMNVFDFEDVMFKYRNLEDESLNFVHLFEGSKEFAVKMYGRNHQKELQEGLTEFGASAEEAKRVTDMMCRKGRIPSVRLADGRVLKNSVHHEWAILDAGLKENPGDVNNMSNFKIVFNLVDPKSGAVSVTEKNENDLSQLFRKNRILLEEKPDLTAMAANPELKKDFIKGLARDKMAELYMALKNFGLPKEELSNVILKMGHEGQIPQLSLGGNKYLAMNLKESRSGIKLVFGVLEGEQEYADVHRGIFHGNSTRPVYMEENPQQKPMDVVAAEHDDSESHAVHEKEAYALENAPEQGGKLKKMIVRVMSKLHKSEENGLADEKRPVFYLGSAKRVIYANAADDECEKNRYQQVRQRPYYQKTIDGVRQ